MARTARYFLWNNGVWVRLSARWFDRFMDGEERVDEEYVLHTATVYLELDDRIPVAISPPRFDRWPLLPDGTLDRVEMMLGPALVMDSMLLRHDGGTVVQAESRFAHRRHKIETTWQPTSDQLTSLVKAIEKTGVTLRLAQLILSER